MKPLRAGMLILIATTLLSGCTSYIDPNVPEMIRPLVEPEHRSDYLLYRPSHYTRNASWPLVVACNGSFADSPDKVIREWTQFAETYGFIVAAPTMQKTGGLFGSKPDKHLETLRADEERILAIIQHVRAGQEISDDRIFLYGRSASTHSVLYTGLKNPEVFRALAISRPKFKKVVLNQIEDKLSRYQPIFLEYSLGDRMLGNDADDCLDWLRSHHMDVTANSSADSRNDVAPLVGFFEDVVRHKPWIHIRVFPTNSERDLQVGFTLRQSFKPTSVTWDFGNGHRRAGLSTTHTYDKPGSYAISVTLDHPDGSTHKRSAILAVPDLVLTKRPHAEDQPDESK